MLKISLTILFIIGLNHFNSQERPVRNIDEINRNEERKVVAQTQTEPAKNSIEIAIEKLVKDPDLYNASISFYVYDVKNKKVIAEHNPNTTLVTASTMKIVTTASALEILGSYHKFTTQLSYDGFIDSNGVLFGNIYIVGGGDPTLGSRFFNKKDEDFMQEWVQAIANLGINEIKGSIIGDDSYLSDEFVPATWGWGDMGNYYGAGVSGLSIYDNTTSFYFNAGPNNNDSTFIECYEPYAPGLIIDNRVKAGDTKSDEAYIYGGPYDNYRVLKGRIPKGTEEFVVKGAMHDPAYVAAFDLEAKLWQYGIFVRKQATTTRALQISQQLSKSKRESFHKTNSPSLSTIVYWTNLVSNNLFAEHLLKHVGVAQYHNGSVYSGTAAITNLWTKKGVDMRGFVMNDGSGLSRANAISSKQLVEILTYMKNSSKYFDSFYSSLPNCGKTGTLSHLGKGTKIYNNLRAKSGTMTRIKSYAGYVTSASNKELAFSIIVNNHNCTTPQIGKKLETLMIALGNYNQ